jgi:hypothetical protein
VTTITINNIARLREISQSRRGWITQVAFSPDGRALGVSDGAGIWLYEVTRTGFRTDSVQGLPHPAPVKGFAFHPTQPIIATACADTFVRLWSGGDQVRLLQGHTDAVNTAAFGKTALITGGAELLHWNWQRPDPQPDHPTMQPTAEITGLTVSDGEQWACSSKDGTVLFGDLMQTHPHILHHPDQVRRVAFSPDGRLLVAASKDGKIYLWRLKSDQPPDLAATIDAHAKGVDSVAFSPDSSLLASGGRDNIVRVWETHKALSEAQNTHNALLTLNTHTKPVLSLAFSPDGAYLATGSGDNTLRLWSID